MAKGIPVTVPPEEVQALATEMTIGAYLETVLLLDKQGNSMLLSLPLNKEDQDG